MKKTSKKTTAKKVATKRTTPLKQPKASLITPVEKKEPVVKQPVAAEKVVAAKPAKEKRGAFLSFLHTVVYLFALYALFAAGLFVYLKQSSDASMYRNYHFLTKKLSTCYARSANYRSENQKLIGEIEHLKKPKKVEPKCPEPQDRHEILNPDEYAPYEKGGSAVIEGDLCFTLEDGVKKCFDRAQVFINPVTSYSDEWYHRGWAGREALKAPDERAVKSNKMTLSDKDGKYKFEGLASGSYYVGAIVCVPKKSTDKNCVLSRYAAKVSMKNRIKPKLKRVYP